MPFGTSTVTQMQVLVLLLLLALATALVARRLRFPYTLALVLVGLLLGLLHLLPSLHLQSDLVLFIFLPLLLFEGSWNLDVSVLRANALAIFLLAVPGLVLSLVVVAAVLHWGAGLPLTEAVLLGAIVSPTDPIAVIALLGRLGMPLRLRVLVEAESLFNDGVGTVAYALALGALLLSLGGQSKLLEGPPALVALKTLWLCVGGPLLGVALGLLVTRLVRQVDDYLIEATITFGTAYGVYLLADALHTSGLLAVVCAGLTLGSIGRRTGMSPRTAEVVDRIWEFAGYLANSLLFLLLGVQIGAVSLEASLGPIAWAVLGVLLGRALMIYLLLPLHDAYARWRLRRAASEKRVLPTRAATMAQEAQALDHADTREEATAAGASTGAPAASDGAIPLSEGLHEVALPTPIPVAWRPLLLLSGLRGALSLALALSLPTLVPQRDQVLLIVYGVVLVTLLGQGIAMRLLLPQWSRLVARFSPPATSA